IGNDCERCSRPELPNWSPSFSRFFPPPLWQNSSASPTWEKRTFTTPQNCGDRKSTRLNSSHLGISYAVFCLKKTDREELGRIADAFCACRRIRAHVFSA